MEYRLEQTRATVASLRALLQESLSHSPVVFRSVASTPALAIRERVGFADCDAWLGAAYAELEAMADAAHLDITGPPGALYPQEFFEAEIGDVVAFVPIVGTADSPSGRANLFDVPAADLAVMVHYGPFSDIDRTYGALGTIVAERAIGIDGPIREHYLVTDADTQDVSQQRTEVCWPISQQPQA